MQSKQNKHKNQNDYSTGSQTKKYEKYYEYGEL